jgi:hypothetical protein
VHTHTRTAKEREGGREGGRVCAKESERERDAQLVFPVVDCTLRIVVLRWKWTGLDERSDLISHVHKDCSEVGANCFV